MGFFDFLKRKPKETKALPAPTQKNFAQAIATSILFHRRPDQRSAENVLKTYGMVPRLHSVVSRIATSVSSVQWKVARLPSGMGQKSRKRLVQRMAAASTDTTQNRNHLLKTIFDEQEMEEIRDHPALEVLRRGNLHLTGCQVRDVIQTNIDLVGEIFIVTEKGDSEQVLELYPAPTSWVDRLPSPTDPFYYFSQAAGVRDRVPKDEVMWIKKVDPANPYGPGLGIATTLRTELDIDEYAARTAAVRFFNNAKPELLVSFEGAKSEVVEAQKADWINRNQGWEKSGLPHFTNSKINVKELTASIKESGLEEMREFVGKMIRETYGVPPEILGIVENSNRATITTANFIYSKWVLEPRLSFLEEQYNNKLMPMFPDGDRFVLFFVSPVPEDKEFKKEIMKNHPAAFSVNQVRDLAGENQIEGPVGESHMVPNNISIRSEEDFMNNPEPAQPPMTDPDDVDEDSDDDADDA